MKCTIKGKVVSLQSENHGEAKRLLSLIIGDEPRKVKKHKKHNFQYNCTQCNQVCKGRAGLAIHTSKAHKVEDYGEPTTREG